MRKLKMTAVTLGLIGTMSMYATAAPVGAQSELSQLTFRITGAKIVNGKPVQVIDTGISVLEHRGNSMSSLQTTSYVANAEIKRTEEGNVRSVTPGYVKTGYSETIHVNHVDHNTGAALASFTFDYAELISLANVRLGDGLDIQLPSTENISVTQTVQFLPGKPKQFRDFQAPDGAKYEFSMTLVKVEPVVSDMVPKGEVTTAVSNSSTSGSRCLVQGAIVASESTGAEMLCENGKYVEMASLLDGASKASLK